MNCLYKRLNCRAASVILCRFGLTLNKIIANKVKILENYLQCHYKGSVGVDNCFTPVRSAEECEL